MTSIVAHIPRIRKPGKRTEELCVNEVVYLRRRGLNAWLAGGKILVALQPVPYEHKTWKGFRFLDTCYPDLRLYIQDLEEQGCAGCPEIVLYSHLFSEPALAYGSGFKVGVATGGFKYQYYPERNLLFLWQLHIRKLGDFVFIEEDLRMFGSPEEVSDRWMHLWESIDAVVTRAKSRSTPKMYFRAAFDVQPYFPSPSDGLDK